MAHFVAAVRRASPSMRRARELARRAFANSARARSGARSDRAMPWSRAVSSTGTRLISGERSERRSDDDDAVTRAKGDGTTNASTSYAFATAMSRETELERALGECARAVRDALGAERRATWAQLYVSGDAYDEKTLEGAGKRVRELLGGDVALVGAVVRASVGGEGVTGEGVTLTAGSMPGTKTWTFRAKTSSLPALDGDGSWLELGRSVMSGDTVAVTAFADASFENVDQLLERLHTAMPNSVTVGGVVDEGSVMFLNDEIVRREAVALLVQGDFEMNAHVLHGAKPIGPVMNLTNARDGLVLELDDTPAHPLLLETLEQLPARAKSLPVMLGLGSNDAKGGPYVCRDILAVGDTGGVELAHSKWNLREGMPVQLHIRDSSWASEEASRAIEKCVSSTGLNEGAAGVGATMFSCGNGNLMHASNFRERAPGTALGGAYLRSEIAPLAQGRASSVLSHTSAIGIYRKRD